MTVKLKFEKVTDREVIRFTHLENSVVWSTDYFTSDEYAEREALLGLSRLGLLNQSNEHIDEHDANAEHLGLKYFVLKDVSLPETSLTSQIVASCETMNRVGWIMVPGSNEIHSVLAACVGGVFTGKKYRGRGYARKMIAMLNEHYDTLANNSEDPFLKYMIMHLYSEVGEYYAKNGYVSYHVPLYEIHDIKGLESRYGKDTSSCNVRYLGYDDYADLVELERQQFKKHMLRTYDGARVTFTVHPSLHNYTWFQDRDIFVSQKFQEQKPNRFGVALPDGSHLVWHHSWTSQCLILLKVHFASDKKDQDETLGMLVKEAIKECQSSNLTHLEFWQDELPPEQFAEFHKALRCVETGNHLAKINSSLSAIRLSPACQNYKCVWLNNTKSCWF